MKILFVGNFFPGSLEVSYLNAFKKTNYDIVTFDYQQEYESINPFANNRYANRLLSGFYNKLLNEKFLKCVKFTNPDLLFIVKGSFIFPETLKKIKEKENIVLFNFNPDNPFNKNRGASNNLIRKSMPYYDIYFIWGKFLIPELLKAGAKKVEYLPFACDTELHYPVLVNQEEKRFYTSDVAFIGSWDKEREEFLLNLVDYNLAIWGNGWEKLNWNSPLRKKWKKKDVIGEEFSKVCNASKIVLNHIRKQNGDSHNMRTFEVPACGGFVLTKKTTEQLDFFEDGKEITCYEDMDDLKKEINFYLENEELRKKIAINGNKKALTHTYNERVRSLLNNKI